MIHDTVEVLRIRAPLPLVRSNDAGQIREQARSVERVRVRVGYFPSKQRAWQYRFRGRQTSMSHWPVIIHLSSLAHSRYFRTLE